ncbi:MAG: xylulokinase [Candidatus Limiplasma sp.]|nr:FGGY family carbohydrate kinase [Clostridiales bacterium]MDY3815808.1 xylulokinase [Candidatus Limiplasma sp.]
MRYLLGVDFGGSSSKATLLGEDGRVYATASREYPTYYPQNGWAEQDADDSYQAMVDNVREILRTSGVHPRDIAALALDAATHTAVLVGENGRPVRRAIYWTDSRAADEAAELKNTLGEELMRECYNSVSSLWTLPQLMWLKKHELETLRKTRKVMAVKDYVRYRLTGDYLTDSIEAMGFLLLDARSNQWSRRLCDLAGLDAALMPPIVDPMTRLSPLTLQAMEDTGLSASTAVIAGATDTVMEVYAAGAIHPGQATVKLATAGRICPITDHAVVDPRLVTYRHVVKGLWYPGTATKSCAASNRWYRDTFGGSFDEMSAAAAAVDRGCQGLYFHPYLQGEITPYLDDKLRASFVGAAGFHTKAHFNRAVLEGVAYSMKDCFATLTELGIAPNQAVAIGGGAKSDLWRQILADMLNVPLRTVDKVDSSLGSAMLAGVAVGVFASHEDAVSRCVRTTGETLPNPEGVAFYNRHFPIYRQIQQALAPVYHQM